LPSLLLSAAEKFGVAELELVADPPVADDCDEPVELLEVEGVEDDDGLEVDDGLVADGPDDDEEDCATASVDRANRTAAVVILRVLGMDELRL
jgi:hypothetical protein